MKYLPVILFCALALLSSCARDSDTDLTPDVPDPVDTTKVDTTVEEITLLDVSGFDFESQYIIVSGSVSKQGCDAFPNDAESCPGLTGGYRPVQDFIDGQVPFSFLKEMGDGVTWQFGTGGVFVFGPEGGIFIEQGVPWGNRYTITFNFLSLDEAERPINHNNGYGGTSGRFYVSGGSLWLEAMMQSKEGTRFVWELEMKKKG